MLVVTLTAWGIASRHGASRARRDNAALHAHGLGAVRRQPTTQVVWQPGVNPISAMAGNLDFAPGWQNQDTVCRIGSCDPRFTVVSRHNRQAAAVFPVLQLIDGKNRQARDKDRQNGEGEYDSPAVKNKKGNSEGAEPKGDRC